jgi:hypothetical protein
MKPQPVGRFPWTGDQPWKHKYGINLCILVSSGILTRILEFAQAKAFHSFESAPAVIGTEIPITEIFLETLFWDIADKSMKLVPQCQRYITCPQLWLALTQSEAGTNSWGY